MKIGLIPLDERPVNTRYPRMLAEIAGAELYLPPKAILSDFRTPANAQELIEWLMDTGTQADVMIVGCETLGYGGLINSRISDEPVSVILNRLESLRKLKQQKPDLRIFGFDLIMRTARSNDSMEEPPYWAEYGARFFHLSQLMDHVEQGEPYQDDLAALRAEMPDAYVNDFLWRRTRNHTVNLALLQMTAEGVFDLLVISSDDTSEYGLGSREKRWLTEMAARLNLGNKLLMYPGADEVGSVLVARAINEASGQAPAFEIDYAVEGGGEITAAFEDSAVRITVERQILAAGAKIAEREGDIYLMVNPPRSPEMEWLTPYTEGELRERVPQLEAAARRLKAQIDAGKVVAVADVGQANGADVEWVEILRREGVLLRLDAYSAWNTAGNATGTTVAQACIAWQHGRDSKAQKRFLAHRILEDWAYMGIVREDVEQWLRAGINSLRVPPELEAQTAKRIEDGLRTLAHEAGIGFGVSKVMLPWKRTFEIDFELD